MTELKIYLYLLNNIISMKYVFLIGISLLVISGCTKTLPTPEVSPQGDAQITPQTLPEEIVQKIDTTEPENVGTVFQTSTEELIINPEPQESSIRQ